MDEPNTPLPEEIPPSGEPGREIGIGPDLPPAEAEAIQYAPDAPAPADEVAAPSSDAPAPADEAGTPSSQEPGLVAEVPGIGGGAAGDEPAAPAEELPVSEAAAGTTQDEAPSPAAAGPTAEAEAEAAEKSQASQEHERLARENAGRLEREIDALRPERREGAPRHYRTFFEHERQLHVLFKELRPLHVADRHRLWTAFKQIGAEARREQQEEWESRRYLSIEARETVEEKIRTAEGLLQGTPAANDYRRADGILNEVRTLLAGEAPGSPGQVLIGPDRRACWDRWRGVRDALRRQRSGLQEQDYETLAGLVAEVVESAKSEDPFKAVQSVKELQARLGKAYLRRGQFEELRRHLSDAWQAAQLRITEQRQERTKRRAEWRQRMEEHVIRWRETLEHRRGQREHLLQQLAKLEGMEKNSRSEDFAVQVRGWKEETTEKLRRVEEFIADFEQRLGSAAKRIGGRGAREHAAGEDPSREGHAGGSAEPGPGPADARAADSRDASADEPPGEAGADS